MATQHKIVANRYTQALWDLCQQEESPKVLEELTNFSNVFEGNGELQKFMISPTFNFKEKAAVLDQLTSSLQSGKTLCKFLKLVLSKGRIEAVGEIARQFKEEVYASSNRAEVHIESAFPLSEEQELKIVTALKKATGKDLVSIVVENKQLVAGIRVNVLGQSIDSSLVSSLGNLKQQLLQGEA